MENMIDKIVERASSDTKFLGKLLTNAEEAIQEGGFQLSTEEMIMFTSVMKLFDAMDRKHILADFVSATDGPKPGPFPWLVQDFVRYYEERPNSEM